MDLLTDEELFENPRLKIIFEQSLTMYDSSCHAKYSLHTSVFRETLRRLGTQRHKYLLDLDKKGQVKLIQFILILINKIFLIWI